MRFMNRREIFKYLAAMPLFRKAAPMLRRGERMSVKFTGRVDAMDMSQWGLTRLPEISTFNVYNPANEIVLKIKNEIRAVTA